MARSCWSVYRGSSRGGAAHDAGMEETQDGQGTSMSVWQETQRGQLRWTTSTGGRDTAGDVRLASCTRQDSHSQERLCLHDWFHEVHTLARCSCARLPFRARGGAISGEPVPTRGCRQQSVTTCRSLGRRYGSPKGLAKVHPSERRDVRPSRHGSR